jgi:hypothetical protein
MTDASTPPEATVETGDEIGPVHRRRRTAVRVLAWVGLALSVVLAIGILLGRTWLAGYVDDVFDTVDGAVANGSSVVALTTGRLEERVADLDGLVADLGTAAATATVPPAIAERATGIADRFGEIRDRWISVRARIDAALATLAQIDRALPFIELPGAAAEGLAALDQRIADIDANITSLRTGATARVGDVIAGASALRGAVDRVAEVGNRIQEGLAEVEDRVDRAKSTIDMVMWLTTALLLLLVGYVAVLNILLIRGYRRP